MKKYLLLAVLLIPGYAGYSQSQRIDNVISEKVAILNGVKAQGAVLKDIFRSPKKAKDVVYILVTNISISDPNLGLLKTAVSKGKNDNITSQFKDGTVILKLTTKTNAGVIYEELDASLKQMFNPSDIDEAEMILVYKAPPVK